MILNTILKAYTFVLIVCSFPVGGIFLPPVLKSKLRTDNETGFYEKVWMKYVEKRLEVLNRGLENREHITSFLEICKRKFRKRIFKNIPVNCEELGLKNPGGMQLSIYGKICSLSEGGKKQENSFIDSCSQVKLPGLRTFCYRYYQKINSKYRSMFSRYVNRNKM